jgi:hypothetical protein
VNGSSYVFLKGWALNKPVIKPVGDSVARFAVLEMALPLKHGHDTVKVEAWGDLADDFASLKPEDRVTIDGHVHVGIQGGGIRIIADRILE